MSIVMSPLIRQEFKNHINYSRNSDSQDINSATNSLRSPESSFIEGKGLPIKTQKSQIPLSYKRGTPAPPRKSQFYHSKKGPASS